jgi:O-antigen/teichoic acid export membrane protein
MSSRKTLLTRGVLLGYGALVTQIFYSLATIPLALSYLNKAEFGLWGLITTLTSYLAMLEFGMLNSFQRHLFECRDNKEDGRYGRLFTASCVAFLLIALFMLVVGVPGALLAAPVFAIPTELQAEFRWLMLGSVGVAAFYMAIRMICAPLYIHQRHDLVQFSQICLYLIMYVVLHLGLRAGWGVYAMLANTAAGGLWQLLFALFNCIRLKLYPPKGTWAFPSRDELKSVLRYSRDFFIIQVGSQFASTMPMLLMPRLLGLEAVAVWTVCTRSFGVLKQVVSKPFEYSLPMLCEIYVKGEPGRMALRWTNVTQLVIAIAACVFAVCAANNSTFISLWVGPHMTWRPANDWLVAIFFLVSLIVAAVFGVVGFHKRFGFTRIAPYAEAALIAINALWMTHLWGLTGLLAAAIVSQLLTRFWFGLRYLASISETKVAWLLRESLLRPLLVLPLCMIAAWICAKMHVFLPGYAGLFLAAGTGTLLSGAMVFFLGVSTQVRSEMLHMLMKPLGKWKAPRREQGDAS